MRASYSLLSGAPIKIPTVRLTTTLTDLYREHCPSIASKRIANIFTCPSSTTDLSPFYPRNHKYAYQEHAFANANTHTSTVGHDPSTPDFAFHHSLATRYISLLTQRDAFVNGPSPTILFTRNTPESSIHHELLQAKATRSVIDSNQKPVPLPCPGPAAVTETCKDADINMVSLKLVLDHVAAAHHDGSGPRMLVDPDLLWTVNSKAALATSGLPTPESEVVDINAYMDDADIDGHEPHPFQSTEIERLVTTLCARARHLGFPLALKLQQSLAGSGTYLLPDSAALDILLKKWERNGTFLRLMTQTNPDNAYLRPAALVLSRMIMHPRASNGLTFFVGEDSKSEQRSTPGRDAGYTFIGASSQHVDESSQNWTGSTIEYVAQPALKAKHALLMSQTADWLRGKGYVGPVGIDVLETSDRDALIVDLNERPSGSMCLAFLRMHFENSGCSWARLVQVKGQWGREKGAGRWKGEIEAGRAVVVAWWEEEGRGWSMGDVVVGGRGEGELQVLAGRMLAECE